MIWSSGRLPGQERAGRGLSLQEGVRADGEGGRRRQPWVHCRARWTLQGPSSLRTPSLLLTNLPTSLGSVKEIDYFPLQLTSGPGSHP